MRWHDFALAPTTLHHDRPLKYCVITTKHVSLGISWGWTAALGDLRSRFLKYGDFVPNIGSLEVIVKVLAFTKSAHKSNGLKYKS